MQWFNCQVSQVFSQVLSEGKKTTIITVSLIKMQVKDFIKSPYFWNQIVSRMFYLILLLLIQIQFDMYEPFPHRFLK